VTFIRKQLSMTCGPTNNTIVCDEQLEVNGFKGPRRVKRKLRGLKNYGEARKALQKIYSNLPKQERRRLDYYRHEISIQTAINNLLLDNGRLPSVMEIEYATGISRTTIYKHLKNEHKGFEEEFGLKINKLRKNAIERLFIIGVKNGNVKALTEFMKLTESKQEEQKDSSLIQINNIYIDQRTIQSLPDDTKDQLVILLLKSAKVDKC